MAAHLLVEATDKSRYAGLESIFEYTNWDGKLCRANCGQAAAATFLTHAGLFPKDIAKACDVMTALEREHPPDQFGGFFGTGRRRVERICRAFGVRLKEICNEAKLRSQLAANRPVIVMLGVSSGRLWNRFDLPGGHWMVAYGFDNDNIYLTNHGKMTWEEFRKGWNSLVPRLIRMHGRGLVHET
jgi:hypothetical protein